LPNKDKRFVSTMEVQSDLDVFKCMNLKCFAEGDEPSTRHGM